MPWARLDDRFHENRKIKRLWRKCPVAVGLYVMSITYCSGHLTDGFVDVDFVEDRLPSARARDRAVSMLVDVGLWIPDANGWLINDYLDFNPSQADVHASALRKSEAGKKGATARWSDSTPHANRMADRMADPMADGCDGDAVLCPDPTRTVEAKASLSDVSRADRERAKATDDDRRLCRLVAELGRAHNPKLKIGSDSTWLRDMRLCRERDQNSPEEIERLLRWVYSEESRDRGGSFWWADVIQSPGNFREHFGQMWAKMRTSTLQAVPVVEDSAAFLARRGAA